MIIGGKEPNNESIEDSIMDGSNYFDLNVMLLWERNYRKKKENEALAVCEKYSIELKPQPL